MKFKREVPPPSRFPIGRDRPHPSQAAGPIGCRNDRVERGPRAPGGRWGGPGALQGVRCSGPTARSRQSGRDPDP